ncbi:MAG TPA: hypothetical protein VFO37_01370, partial [Chitinophagaceae bacterium]|nr:hypothetical protein [Chitinophagaceae bacterium]
TKDTMYSALGAVMIFPNQDKIITRNTAIESFACSSFIPPQYLYFLKMHPELNIEILAGVFKGKELIKQVNTGVTLMDLLNKKNGVEPTLDLSDISPAKYVLRFGIKSKNYPVTHNSGKIQLIIR